MGQTRAQKRPAAKKEAEQEGPSDEQQDRKPHPIEWVAGGVSAVVVVAMIAFILYEAISVTTPDPQLSVTVEQVEATGAGFRVEFRAINQGDATAAAVEIQGQIKRGDETIETSEVTLDYVPSHSERKGGLIFNNDPGAYQLQIEALGYSNP